MQIAARHLDKITIFDISGDIDLATSPQLRKALLREFRELKVPRVVLNLGAVRYIDSSGVASLVEGLKASRDVGSAVEPGTGTRVARHNAEVSTCSLSSSCWRGSIRA